MRQVSIIGAVAGLVAATLSVSPASAGPAPVAVDGDHFAASGLTLVSQGCTNSRTHPKTEPEFLVKHGPGNPPIGDFSVGWDEKGTSFGVGVAAHVADPTTLKTLGVAINAANEAHGHVVAMFHATGDPGTWRGDANLGVDNTSGWHRVNAANVTYTWTHFTDGAADGTDSGTLQDLAGRRGGDGDGAELGFLYGCDGNPFFTDALTVATKAASRTYDLGGYRAAVKLRTYPGIARRIHVTYGVLFNLTGKMQQKTTGNALAGRLTIQTRRLGGSTWNGIASKKLAPGGSIKVGVRPSRSVTYRAFYPGNTTTYEPGASRLVTVIVSPYIATAFADATVIKGHVFTLRGRVLPQQRRPIQLQRFLDGKWRTVKKGSTQRDGHYGISAITTRMGKSYWRIRVPAGGGNATGTSPWRKLTTTAPPSGGGGGPTDDPPPPPQDDPPPPPPPTH